ncbi:hypothetical protein FBUS_04883 [Fasciolopsis buskii]|uniref:Protein FMC1 homolog n=1 Tax=Fasciolopsis buskii TaxID=27845 RepID=A0A8E0RMM0_9TREM|nr:hypothetical protein FBUS_04883 [Fasciolopsis buski]
MSSSLSGRNLLRSLLRELKTTYNGQIPFCQSLLVRHLLNEFRYNQLTDAQKCAREQEARHVAETYNSYLVNVRRHMELIEKYKSREKTTEEAARMVGLEIPKGPRPTL